MSKSIACFTIFFTLFLACARETNGQPVAQANPDVLNETLVKPRSSVIYGWSSGVVLEGTAIWSAAVRQNKLKDILLVNARATEDGVVHSLEGAIDLADVGTRDGARLVIVGPRSMVPNQLNGVITYTATKSSQDVELHFEQLETVEYDLVIDAERIEGRVVLHKSDPSLYINGRDSSLERELTLRGSLLARGCEVFEAEGSSNMEIYAGSSHELCEKRFAGP
jgi:hypothetical protein